MVDISWYLYYTTKGIEAWLSLVERCVRDAEAACSNHVASIFLKAWWSSGQDDALSRRKPGFDSRTGHFRICFGVNPEHFLNASVAQMVEQRIRNAWVAGSSPASGCENPL